MYECNYVYLCLNVFLYVYMYECMCMSVCVYEYNYEFVCMNVFKYVCLLLLSPAGSSDRLQPAAAPVRSGPGVGTGR